MTQYTETKKYYVINGIILGEFWGGGSGSYPSRKITGDNMEELINKAIEMLNNGSLDSGMGFERLKGALLNIETVTVLTIDEKEFTNKENEDLLIGELTEDEIDFLYETIFSY